ncbi:type II toxin-antitoxin system RelE family toxin [Archangium sp.]|uniref:type II toxin-antitoxin system RelE family toxin n=1 Tax=Archangium sp. TaxID=1872627 RepID=UPI0038998AB5
MRRPQDHTGYSVEVSAAAWKQLSHLPLEAYERIRTELDTLAATLRTPTPPPLPQEGARPVNTRAIVLEGYVAHYEVDRERRRLTLREVAHHRPSDT